ncbi:F-box/kelch-repeat protein At3g06240-like [Apium graveolens]|uniref:F-box/kelch-repeat protein At3g06240-like n=1 Tax=Apium graveolens TaxID=4045 RepID=UPI003D7BD7A9
MATHENANANSVLLNDLLYDILSRLSVKTLLQCRSVCKSRLSLISSPEFIKIYNSRFTQHRLVMSQTFYLPHVEFEGLILEHLWLKSCSLYSLLNESVTDAIQLDLYPMKFKDRFTYVVGCCHGLVCLAGYDGCALLWNPTTKKSRKLPQLTLSRRGHELVVCGFGYDESKDDYKVFSFFTGHTGFCRFWVYSLKSDCWRMIENLTVTSLWDMGKLAHGALNWVVQREPCFIVSIAVKTEMYREITVPEHQKDSDTLALHTLGENLCVVHYVWSSHAADIWIMNEYVNSVSGPAFTHLN